MGLGSVPLGGVLAGASIALAFAALHPKRLSSLALLEPAWAGNWDDASPAHRALCPEYARLAALPTQESMPAFVRIQLRTGVVPPEPPPGPAPPWMAKRPAGIRAIIEAFRTYDLDRDALYRFDRPVYFDADSHLASADSEATHDWVTYWAPGLRWSGVLKVCLTWPNGRLDATLRPTV